MWYVVYRYLQRKIKKEEARNKRLDNAKLNEQIESHLAHNLAKWVHEESLGRCLPGQSSYFNWSRRSSAMYETENVVGGLSITPGKPARHRAISMKIRSISKFAKFWCITVR